MFFSDFRACCGVAAFTPAADPPQQDQNSAGNNRASSVRQPVRRNPSVNWKPALSAISEDDVIASDHRSMRREGKGGYQEITKSTVTIAPPTSHGDGYRKEDSSWTVLPSFTPMPFMF